MMIYVSLYGINYTYHYISAYPGCWPCDQSHGGTNSPRAIDCLAIQRALVQQRETRENELWKLPELPELLARGWEPRKDMWQWMGRLAQDWHKIGMVSASEKDEKGNMRRKQSG